MADISYATKAAYHFNYNTRVNDLISSLSGEKKTRQRIQSRVTTTAKQKTQPYQQSGLGG